MSSSSSWQPPTPAAAIVPGALLTVAGVSMLDSGQVVFGSAFVAVGLCILLIGTIAKGVHWGLALHARDTTPRRHEPAEQGRRVSEALGRSSSLPDSAP